MTSMSVRHRNCMPVCSASGIVCNGPGPALAGAERAGLIHRASWFQKFETALQREHPFIFCKPRELLHAPFGINVSWLIIPQERGGCVMTQLLLQDSSPWLVENWLSYDWPVYVAFLLALLVLAGIVVTAAIATSWHD
jgi:hypothetical protein